MKLFLYLELLLKSKLLLLIFYFFSGILYAESSYKIILKSNQIKISMEGVFKFKDKTINGFESPATSGEIDISLVSKINLSSQKLIMKNEQREIELKVNYFDSIKFYSDRSTYNLNTFDELCLITPDSLCSDFYPTIPIAQSESGVLSKGLIKMNDVTDPIITNNNVTQLGKKLISKEVVIDPLRPSDLFFFSPKHKKAVLSNGIIISNAEIEGLEYKKDYTESYEVFLNEKQKKIIAPIIEESRRNEKNIQNSEKNYLTDNYYSISTGYIFPTPQKTLPKFLEVGLIYGGNLRKDSNGERNENLYNPIDRVPDIVQTTDLYNNLSPILKDDPFYFALGRGVANNNNGRHIVGFRAAVNYKYFAAIAKYDGVAAYRTGGQYSFAGDESFVGVGGIFKESTFLFTAAFGKMNHSYSTYYHNRDFISKYGIPGFQVDTNRNDYGILLDIQSTKYFHFGIQMSDSNNKAFSASFYPVPFITITHSYSKRTSDNFSNFFNPVLPLSIGSASMDISNHKYEVSLLTQNLSKKVGENLIFTLGYMHMRYDLFYILSTVGSSSSYEERSKSEAVKSYYFKVTFLL